DHEPVAVGAEGGILLGVRVLPEPGWRGGPGIEHPAAHGGRPERVRSGRLARFATGRADAVDRVEMRRFHAPYCSPPSAARVDRHRSGVAPRMWTWQGRGRTTGS